MRFKGIFGRFEGLWGRSRVLGRDVFRMVGNDEIRAIWEFFRERFPSFAAHNDGVPRCGLPEKAHIFLEVENEVTSVTEFAILSDSGDDGEHFRVPPLNYAWKMAILGDFSRKSWSAEFSDNFAVF